jgi:hypothetical protein
MTNPLPQHQNNDEAFSSKIVNYIEYEHEIFNDTVNHLE